MPLSREFDIGPRNCGTRAPERRRYHSMPSAQSAKIGARMAPTTQEFGSGPFQ
jgi:hypothetical protein